MKRRINIINNQTELSKKVYDRLKTKLEKKGFEIPDDFSYDAELTMTIGGDGILLNAVQKYGYPKIPFVGINTGHLGFFQEVDPDELDAFIEKYINREYSVQELSTVKATVKTSEDEYIHRGLNEIVIRGAHVSHTTHLDISIGDSFMEKFSGDGVLISTPAGSTAYNYSLRGSIVDPRIRALQVTPIAPMNTNAYRSFSSSLLVPMDIPIIVHPSNLERGLTLCITNDSDETTYENVLEIQVEMSKKVITLIRFENYDFWDKVMTKFL